MKSALPAAEGHAVLDAAQADTERLRSQARAHVADGAVTAGYGPGRRRARWPMSS